MKQRKHAFPCFFFFNCILILLKILVRFKEKQSSMKMIEGKINVLTQENSSQTTSKESEVV